MCIDPTFGDLPTKLREACIRVLEEAGIRVTVRLSAGRKMKAQRLKVWERRLLLLHSWKTRKM